MQIVIDKFQKSPAIKIYSRGGRKIFLPTENIDNIDESNLDSVAVATHVQTQTDSKRLKSGGFLIATPGEYEVDEAFITAQINQKDTSNEIDIVEVEIDGVRAMYYGSSSVINREVLSVLGIIDILVINITDGSLDNIQKNINSIDPQIVIPVGGDKDKVEKFKKELGISFEEESKIRFKQSDFKNEDYVLHGIILSK